MDTKCFTYNFTLLMTGRTFHRLASGCILALYVWAMTLGVGTVDVRRIFDTHTYTWMASKNNYMQK